MIVKRITFKSLHIAIVRSFSFFPCSNQNGTFVVMMKLIKTLRVYTMTIQDTKKCNNIFSKDEGINGEELLTFSDVRFHFYSFFCFLCPCSSCNFFYYCLCYLTFYFLCVLLFCYFAVFIFLYCFYCYDCCDCCFGSYDYCLYIYRNIV